MNEKDETQKRSVLNLAVRQNVSEKSLSPPTPRRKIYQINLELFCGEKRKKKKGTTERNEK